MDSYLVCNLAQRWFIWWLMVDDVLYWVSSKMYRSGFVQQRFGIMVILVIIS